MQALTKDQDLVTTFKPRMDLHETVEAVTVLVDLPGVARDELSVEFDNDVLTVSATRKVAPATRDYLHREFQPGNYRRSLRLSKDLDPSGITAQLENGLLTLIVPRKAAALPRKIEIR